MTPLNGTLPHPLAAPHMDIAPVLVQSPNSQDEENRIKKYEVSRKRGVHSMIITNNVLSFDK